MTYRPKKIIPTQFAAMSLAVGLHIAMLEYLLDRTNRWPLAEAITTSLKMHVVEGEKTQRQQLTPMPLNMDDAQPNILAPELTIAQEHRDTLPIMQLIDSRAQTILSPTIATTGPRPDPSKENTFPDNLYPQQARRANQQGTVVLSLQILTDGSIGDAQIEKSSGFNSLDKAAAHYAQLNWHFIPGTRNGEPVVDWRRVSVIFSNTGVSVKY
jgi:TonB family protein